MEYSISFLGSSQTFLGTLATIIILFIVIDRGNENSNLIQYILKEVKLKVDKQLKGLVRRAYFNPTDDVHYDDINMRLEKGIADKGLENEANKLLLDIKSSQDDFMLNNDAGTEYYDEEKSNCIVHAKELSLAPLYTLTYCIIIFLYDELFRAHSVHFNDCLNYSLSIFTIFSLILWIWMWCRNLFIVIRKIKDSSDCTNGTKQRICNTLFKVKVLLDLV